MEIDILNNSKLKLIPYSIGKIMNCIIQARMSSKRLPGKTLKKINNYPILKILLNNLKKSNKIKKIIVATSKNQKDKKIIKYCKINKIDYYEGTLHNVFKRLLNCAKYYKFEHFIRINGDSPFIDAKLINKIINKSKKKNYDIYTNVFPRSFPKGQSIEIIKTSIMEGLNFKLNKSQREHVTKYFYENSKKYKIYNFHNPLNYSKFNLSIDYKTDLIKFRKIFKKYTLNKYYSYKKLLELELKYEKN